MIACGACGWDGMRGVRGVPVQWPIGPPVICLIHLFVGQAVAEPPADDVEYQRLHITPPFADRANAVMDWMEVNGLITEDTTLNLTFEYWGPNLSFVEQLEKAELAIADARALAAATVNAPVPINQPPA